MVKHAGLWGKRRNVNWLCTGQVRLAMNDDEIKKPKTHEVGMSLDALSAEELSARIQLLETEIVRLKAAIAARGQSRQAAEAAFKF